MFVTERDLLILKMCLEQKFMTLKQISRRFFPESQNMFQVPMKRVRLLVKAGLLKAEILRVDQKRLYMTTARGLGCLKRKGLSGGLGVVKELNVNTWEHDEWVTDIRLHFEQELGFGNWISERILKKGNIRKKVPDGMFPHDLCPFLIEAERHIKNKRYYEKVFSEMCIKHCREGLTLYIIEKESEKEWLMKEARGWNRIYFSTMKDFMQNWEQGAFENFERSKLVFDGDGNAHLEEGCFNKAGLLHDVWEKEDE